MVLLTATPQIITAIASIPPESRSSLKRLPEKPGSPIEHKTLISLSHLANGLSLNTLLKGSQVYVPPSPPKPQPTPEYVALMARLKREQEQREYASLTAKQTQEDDDAQDKDDISPSLVFNILLSVVMCAIAVFHVTRYWHNDGLRVLASLAAGILVGVAEVTVYAAYLRKVNESKTKERAKKERKVFIGEYTGENAIPLERDEKVDASQSEKEEIWGRGVHGGMRRRVREKWEKEQASSDNKQS